MSKKRFEIEALAAVTRALDEISYQWLSDMHPELATAIDLAIDNGRSPLEIRRHVMGLTARMELALRCEQYARASVGEV